MADRQIYAPAVELGRLSPHPGNPRQGDVGAIYQSVRANGFYGAIIAQKSTGRILAGYHRWLAAREAGLETVPVLWLDVDEDSAVRIMLSDNRTADRAAYNEALLVDILRDLDQTPQHLEGTGWDVGEMEERAAAMVAHIEIEAAEPDSKAGGKGKRPVYELVFDGDEALGRFRSYLEQLKTLYPHWDSVESRLMALLEATCEAEQSDV